MKGSDYPWTTRPGRAGSLIVFVGIGIAVIALAASLAAPVWHSARNAVSAPSHASLIRPLASWSSYYDHWWTPNDLNRTGTGCGTGASTYAGPHMTSDTSGIIDGAIDAAPAASAGCTPMWMSLAEGAGEHACIGTGCPSTSTYFVPTTTGFYTFTATWVLSLSMYVLAFCPSGGVSGSSLSDYAEVNVTPYMAIYNQSNPDGWGVPNNFQMQFHMDTRDLVCVTNLQGYHFASQAITLTKTVTSDTVVYLTAGFGYEPRAALHMEMFVVATSSYQASAYWQSSNSPTNSHIATLTSIAVA